jgi:hypothetical protein
MNLESYSSDSSLAGLTFGQWTVKWWEWAISNPAIRNPVVDDTGQYASVNQPNSVWFLAGVLADEKRDRKFPMRECTIPSGRPILIPILNCETDSVEYPELKQEGDLLSHLAKQVESIEKRNCFINGQEIRPERVRSDPMIFEIYVHPDFDQKYNKGGHTRAAADGFWVFLKPPPAGKYFFKFEGSCENGKLNSGAEYRITVSP